jgi:hypothetical protein
MRPADCIPITTISERSPDISESILAARQSDIDDMWRTQGTLHLGRSTLKLSGELDYDEPKVLTGGHIWAACSMTIEGVDQQFKGKVVVPLPGQVHTWLKEHIFDRSSPEPSIPVFLESWPVEPGVQV